MPRGTDPATGAAGTYDTPAWSSAGPGRFGSNSLQQRPWSDEPLLRRLPQVVRREVAVALDHRQGSPSAERCTERRSTPAVTSRARRRCDGCSATHIASSRVASFPACRSAAWARPIAFGKTCRAAHRGSGRRAPQERQEMTAGFQGPPSPTDKAVHRNVASVSGLRLADGDEAGQKIHVAPREAALLAPSQPGVHAHGEQWRKYSPGVQRGLRRPLRVPSGSSWPRTAASSWAQG